MKIRLLFIFLIFLSSCSSMKVIELGEKASIMGIEVSQKALDSYKLISNQAEIEKSQQDKLSVLTNPDPASMKLPNKEIHDFSKQLKPRVEAYKALLNAYNAFSLLTDSKYGDKTQEAVSALNNCYNSFEKLPEIPSSISSKLPEFSKLISQSIQAKKVKNHNQILFLLTQLYCNLWDEDIKTWSEYIDFIYDRYSSGLNSVESKRYDFKKISQTYKEPYSDESTIILMYRLEKRDEIVKQKNEIKNQLNDFGKALKELNRIHAEISKNKTSISDVSKMLNTIDNLLKQE